MSDALQLSAPSQYLPAVFIGDVAIDEYFRAEFWPRPGDKGTIESTGSFAGGSIANAACVHAGFGGATEFISLLNYGASTNLMLETLDEAGVLYPNMLFDTSIGDQRNLIFIVEGEHVVLTPDLDDRPMKLSGVALAALAGPGFVYTTLRRARRLRAPGRDGAAVLGYLRAAGRHVVFDLDVDGFNDDDREFLRGAHVVLMNDLGFENSFGLTADGENCTAKVQKWLTATGVGMLVRSRASKGVVAYTLDGSIVISGYDVPVVDVTGAGDTLGGALVYALGQEEGLRSALGFAVAAASRSVMHYGSRGGVSTPEDVREFHEHFRRTQDKSLGLPGQKVGSA